MLPQDQCQNVCYLFSEQEGKTDDIQELRNKIMEVLRQEPYMGEKIPVRLIIYNIVLFLSLFKSSRYCCTDIGGEEIGQYQYINAQVAIGG